MLKRRYKGFDYEARNHPDLIRTSAPEAEPPVEDVAPPEEVSDADSGAEAGVEVGGEAQGAEGEGEESPHDEGEGEGESEG
jgi:hypothetical protein